jgi:hypothetical protein
MLKLLSAYSGAATLEEVFLNPRASRLLWLEILVNDRLDLNPFLGRSEVRDAYQKACRWYTTYRSLISSVIPRAPLPLDSAPIDPREYRTFAEALRFVADHD